MARKELAGLAALGALAMMANKSKKTEVEEPGEINERMDRANAISRGKTNLVDTGMSTPEPDENYRNLGLSTSSVGVGTASPRMKTPAVRKRPSLDTSKVSDVDLTGGAKANAQQQFDEANARAKTPEGRAERARMESSQALEAVRPEEAMIGGGGLKTVAALARGLANRKGAAKLAEYSTPQLGYEPLKLGSEALKLRKNGGAIKMAKGGMARSSASSRGDGIASKGKTRGRMC